MPETLLRASEAASRLGVTRKTIRFWALRGLVPCVTSPSGERRFFPAVINALAEQSAESNRNPLVVIAAERLGDFIEATDQLVGSPTDDRLPADSRDSGGTLSVQPPELMQEDVGPHLAGASADSSTAGALRSTSKAAR
jgi:hypothetical protein